MCQRIECVGDQPEPTDKEIIAKLTAENREIDILYGLEFNRNNELIGLLAGAQLELERIQAKYAALTQGQPAAWQNLYKPWELIEHDQLDPQWQFMHRPLFALEPLCEDEIVDRPSLPARTSVIDALVDRFLSWKLPKGFSPDCGISFDGRKDDDWNRDKTWPVGTNLFSADQAREMINYLLSTAPQPPDAKT